MSIECSGMKRLTGAASTSCRLHRLTLIIIFCSFSDLCTQIFSSSIISNTYQLVRVEKVIDGCCNYILSAGSTVGIYLARFLQDLAPLGSEMSTFLHVSQNSCLCKGNVHFLIVTPRILQKKLATHCYRITIIIMYS